MAKKPQNALKWLQMTLFAFIAVDPSIVFSETLSKCGGNCTKYKTTVTDLGKTLVLVPRGLLGVKTPLLGLFLQIYRITDMYVYLVVFHGAELKNECFNT